MFNRLLITVILFLFLSETIAQKDNLRGSPKTIHFSIQNDKNGPISVSGILEYEFWKESLDGIKYYLGISYKLIQLTYNQNAGFRMNGKVYLPNELNSQDGMGNLGFDKIQVDDVQIPFQIQYLNTSIIYNTNFYSKARIAEVSKDAIVNSYTLLSSSDRSQNVYWKYDDELRNRVDAIAKKKSQNNSQTQNINKTVTSNTFQKTTPGLTVESRNSSNNSIGTQKTNTNNNYNNSYNKNYNSKLSNYDRNNSTVNNYSKNNTSNTVTNSTNNSVSSEELVNRMMTQIKTQQQQTQQIYQNIDNVFNKMNNDFKAMGSYQERIDAGNKRLNDASQLSGNYNSVEEIEREFATKYSSIRSITEDIQNQQNAKLSFALASKLSTNATEMAIGQGLNLVGSIINGAKAARDAKEAQEALRLQKDAEIKRFEEERRKALIGMRTELFKRFPDGNLPLSSFKTDYTTLYFFSYINERSKIEDPTPSISITSIFPVVKFADGTFPYKASILNRLNGLAAGNISIVGHFESPEKAEEIRQLFIRLAESSKFNVKQIQLKVNPQTAQGSTAITTLDFWENGKVKDSGQVKKTEKKGSFWDN